MANILVVLMAVLAPTIVLRSTAIKVNLQSIKLPAPIDNLLNNVKQKQTVCVSGQLKCNTTAKDAKNVHLKLYDIDQWNPNDVMGEDYSWDDGRFYFCGSGRDMTNDVDPVLEIYHRCNSDKKSDCVRKFKFIIPPGYVDGRRYEFPNDIDLDSIREDEETHCL